MGNISLPNTIANGQQADATPVMANFNTIVNDYNGNIQNVNIANAAAIAYAKLNLSASILNSDINASSAIAYSKLNLTGNIVNADIGATAAIVDTKLAQITTASKVSATALTSLSSLSVSAGIIPDVNVNFKSQIFTSTGTNTWNCPSTVNFCFVTMVGAGGGGCGGQGGGGSGSYGGGSAAYYIKEGVVVLSTNNYTITVGARGL